MSDTYDPRLKLDDEYPVSGDSRDPAMQGVNGHAAPIPNTAAAPRHLRDFVKVVYKRRWLVSATFVAIMTATVLYTYTRVPMYEARAKLLIEPDDPFYVAVPDVIEQNRASVDYYQTQYNLLRSRSLGRRTVQALQLDAATAPETDAKPAGFLSAAGAYVAGFFTSKAAVDVTGSAPAPVAETGAERRAINLVLGGLIVEPVRSSRIVDLKFRSANADLATRIVNAHARSYIEQITEYKFVSSKEAGDWLADRLGEQRKVVERAEAALQNYRETKDALSADSSENIIIQKLGDLNREVTRAKTARLTKEAVYEQLRALEPNAASLDTFPAVLMNPVIQDIQAEIAKIQRRRLELSQNYLDTHPEMETLRRSLDAMNSRLRTEIAKVVEGVRNDFLAARAQEQSLEAALNQQKGEALALNKRAIDYGVLSREVESARAVYQMLLQRASETGVSRQLRTTNVRIVDSAEVPAAPIYPNVRGNLMMGLFGGFGAALLLAFFFEYLDSRIKTPDEIRIHLRIPALGLLPLVRGEIEGGRPLISQPVSPKFNEALRSLRTSVLFSCAEAASRSLVITSTGPSEGKTVVSSNLAVGFAEAGQRVLLIDADMRRPQLHGVFGVPQEPGLSNLLVGTSKASQTVVKTQTPGLWLLPAGHLPPNPAELLSSVRFRNFLASLRDHFDWILLDTPPVMAVTDASVIAHLASGVVFVVGTEMVSRHAAAAALDQLETARGKLLGGVLNRVDLDRNAYYYSQYYRKEYNNYYTGAGT